MNLTFQMRARSVKEPFIRPVLREGLDTACANHRDLSAGLGVQGRPWVLVVLTAVRATETTSLFIQVDQVSESPRLRPRDGKAQIPAMFCQGIKQRGTPEGPRILRFRVQL